MRDLGRVDHLVAGAVGPPGRRAFFLEVESRDGREWYALEKEQVAMLAAAALEILDEIGSPGSAPGPRLEAAGEPRFRVGQIGVGLEDEDLVGIVLTPIDGDTSEPVSFRVAPGLLDSMARRAVEVVAAGRPPCPWCGLPRDPEGHVCPSSNGDLR